MPIRAEGTKTRRGWSGEPAQEHLFLLALLLWEALKQVGLGLRYMVTTFTTSPDCLCRQNTTWNSQPLASLA